MTVRLGANDTARRSVLSGAHNLVHMWLNGTMSNVPTAPATLSGAKAILDPWPEKVTEVLGLHDGDYTYSYDFLTRRQQNS